MPSWSMRALRAWMVTCALVTGACETNVEPAPTDAGPPDVEVLADAGPGAEVCVPACEPSRCGMPDGCGGVCPACEAPPTCSCEGRVCGDDGCGGSCGSCADGESCAPGGARCDCGDATVTYRFSVPEIDWTSTGRVEIQLRQGFPRQADPEWRTVVLDRYSPEAEHTIEGACEPDLELRWSYVSRFRDALGRALRCEGDVRRVTGETTIELPAGTGGACRPT